MREIKFRAKALEDGRWVYGTPVFQDDETFIVLDGQKVAVNKETICEYIGLHTIGGVEIYENDIYTVEPRVSNTMLRQVIHHISGFAGKQLGRKAETYSGRKFVPVDDMKDVMNEIFIIGNSIDNPDLLNVTQRSKEALFEVAADWWVDKTFGTLLNQNNGEESHFGFLNYVAVKGKEGVTEDQIKAFRQYLIDALKVEKEMRTLWLDVDYHPGQYLDEACEKSGVSEVCLPCKTNMHIYTEDGYISVSFGYGAPHINI